MITKLEAVQFAGIKKILEEKEAQDLGELAIRLEKVLRILKGFGTESPGIVKCVMELSRIKDISDELLAIKGIGNGSGELLFDEAIKKLKTPKLLEKVKVLKNRPKSHKSGQKPSKSKRKQAKVKR